MNKDKIIKPLLLITVLIIFCSIFVRTFSGSETLAEYAAKNPEALQPKAETEAGEILQPEPETKAEEMEFTEEQLPERKQAKENSIIQDSDSNNAEPVIPTDTRLSTNNTASTENKNDDDINHIEKNSEDDNMTVNPDRVVYQNGFYYEPLSEEMIKRITGISYPVTEAEKEHTMTEAVNIVNSAKDIQVSYDDLCYMSVLHYNFHGVERTGELICNKAIAQDLVEIFYELYQNEYQIEQIRLIDEYSGDDTLSMQDNNTSCFNYRVVDGTSSLSKHAMGLAIDINPFFNPYVVFKSDGTTYISPQGSETYADRSQSFAYKIDENDLCYKLFKEHGFIWGGNWNSCKDYQHFQKVPD